MARSTARSGRASAGRAQDWKSQAADGREEPDAVNAPKDERKPLVQVGHGVQLRIHNGALVARNGLSHYPQQVEWKRRFPEDPKLPSWIIAVDCDWSITLDMRAFLAQRDIPLIQLDYRGKVHAVASRSMQPYDLALREAQIAAATNGVGLEIATELIRRKIKGCQETLLTFGRTEKRDRGLQKLQLALRDLEKVPVSMDALRVIEARAALAYFLCSEEVRMRWKGIGRKPIPEEWHRGGMRQGILEDGTNRHAVHPLNVMLNYAYAALESKVRIEVIAEGLDPTLGFLHASHHRRFALVYDVMEPLRPQVDRCILDFVRQHTFAPADFVITQTGVCRLHPQLARQIVALSSGVAHADIARTVRSHLMRSNESVSRSNGKTHASGAKVGRRSVHMAQ